MLFLYKEAKLIKNGFIRMAYKEAICRDVDGPGECPIEWIRKRKTNIIY